MKYASRLTSMGIALALLMGCSSKPKSDDRVVLKAGKLTMTLNEVNQVFQNRQFTGPDDEFNQKKAFLEDRLDKMLLADAGLELGLGDSVVIDTQVANNILYSAFMQKKMQECLDFSDGELKKFWDKYGGIIKVAHILVKNEQLADSLYEILKDNPDKIAELAKQYSIDPYSKDNGGIIDSIRYGMMVTEFSEAAFSLKPGRISKPVKTTYGWHIIKTIERREHAEADFKSTDQLIRGVYSTYLREQFHKEFREKIIKSEHMTIDTLNFKLLAAKVDGLQAQTTNLNSSIQLNPQMLSPEEAALVIAKTDNVKLTAKEFLEYLNSRRNGGQFDWHDSKGIEDEVVNRLLGTMAVSYIKKSNFGTSPEYKRKYQDQVNSSVFQKMRNKLQASVPVSDSEVRAEYDKNIYTYTDPAKVRVSEILLASRPEAEAVLKSLKGGTPFASLLNKTIRPGLIERKGDLGFLNPNMYPELYSEAIKLNVSEYGGPVESKGQFSVFRVIEKIAAQPQPFDKASLAIKNRLQKDKFQKVMNSWTEERKTKVEHSIDLDLLKNNLKTGQLKNAV